ncbi:transmembrane protein [Achlya hypogyna]|uniref:Transmembrane protein n=1 Tax=Achlya hypogyna TaxID=1202772 RepID=A0A1V9ZSK1_ACHHY|nr:transmembrane protein [Achlya hypogyna]
MAILRVLLASVGLVNAVSVCDLQAFAAQPLVALGSGPMTMKSITNGTDSCFQVSVPASASASWVSIAIASAATMVTSPIGNVVIYDTTATAPQLYEIQSYKKTGTVLAKDQSPVMVKAASTVNGATTYTFERSNAMKIPSDVAIVPDAYNIINWAYGSAKWPSMHEGRGSAKVAIKTAAIATSVCDLPAFAALPLTTLGAGPMQIKALTDGTDSCFQVTVPASASASWAAVAIASSSAMVTSPVGNTVLFDSTTAKAQLYEIQSYKKTGTVLANDQSPIAVTAAAATNGALTYTFLRANAVKAATDVAVVPDAYNTINWAYGTSKWPSMHQGRGSANIVIKSVAASTTGGSDLPTIDNSAVSLRVITYTDVITAVAFFVILLLGIVVTHIGQWHILNHSAVCSPPTSAGKLAALQQTFADLKLGECIVLIVYLLALCVVSFSVHVKFANAAPGQSFVLVTGHLGLVNLMLILLPVARGHHWEVIFGIGHERILKFHKWLGRSFVLLTALHLVLSLNQGGSATYAQPYGTQEAIPLYGFISFLCFASMGLMAFEGLRRRCYEVFYWHHRAAAIAGLVFAVLHAPAILVAMIFPLSVYALNSIWRFTAYFRGHNATLATHRDGTTVVSLEPSLRTAKWAATMNTCAFFYVNIPTVSGVQWHPFSAIATLDGGSIGFCIKALAKGTFVDKVHAHARAALEMDPAWGNVKVRVEGPYGKAAVILQHYDVVVLVAGGIGVTPMLNIINQDRHRRVLNEKQQMVLHWIVREPQDLLCADPLMYPLPSSLESHFVVTKATASGGILNMAGESVGYTNEKPRMDMIINRERFGRRKVCVLACGPAGLVRDVHVQADACGFDFHKERLLLLSLAAVFVAGDCSSAAFQAAPYVALDPSLSMRSLIQDSSVCMQVLLKKPAAWVSIALSRASTMVTSPFTNAVVMEASSAAPRIVTLQGYAANQLVDANLPAFELLDATAANGELGFTFKRPLAAAYAGDVTLEVGVATIVNWAYASAQWPTIHDARGSAKITFSTAAAVAPVIEKAESPVLLSPDTTVIAAASVVSMIMLGLIATHFGRWRWINYAALCPPAPAPTALARFYLPLVDLKCGECIVVLIYTVCVVLVGLAASSNFPDATLLRRWSLASGHVSLVHLMLLLLPVARGQHWEVFFGISHERILKFHRWLGRLCIIFGAVHLIATVQQGAAVFSREPFGTQQVEPFYGFAAFVLFLAMGISAIFRRKFYSVFYWFHRAASFAGLLLVLMHAKAVLYALILPIGVYLLSGLGRLRGFYVNRFHAAIRIHGDHTVTFVLPTTDKTKVWADNLHPGAFFFVNIPSISPVAWHPFSAIVTPDGDSIGFCMKAHTPGRFVHKVWARAHGTLQDNAFFVLDSTQSAPSMTVRVEGPYGKAAVNVDDYDAAVLICGGSGITPMLSVVNMERRKTDGPKLFLHWVVKNPNDLLCVDKLMFPLPQRVSARFYAGSTAGTVRSKCGAAVSYCAGRPVIEEILNNEKFVGKRVCVLACGPPGLVWDVQYQAHRCAFDFHKEIFEF